jgi:hypothetical protein
VKYALLARLVETMPLLLIQGRQLKSDGLRHVSVCSAIVLQCRAQPQTRLLRPRFHPFARLFIT